MNDEFTKKATSAASNIPAPVFTLGFRTLAAVSGSFSVAFETGSIGLETGVLLTRI